MGYWGQPERYGEKQIDAIIRREFSGSNLKVLDTASRGNVHYLAVEVTALDGSNHTTVMAFVCLTRKNQGDLDIKVMDETCGPFYCDAPKRLISKLSPTDEAHAIDWREACLNKNNKKGAR